MATTKRLEYYNLHCKFGDNLNLLDLAEEVVLPAIEDTNQRRVTKRATYLFNDVRDFTVRDGNTEYWAIGGHFIKVTKLVRSQIFDEESDQIVQSEDELDTAPSSLFILILDNHKLLYLRETENSPGPQAFGATLQKFINNKRKPYLRLLRDQRAADASNDPTADKMTIKTLEAQYPAATVDIVPLSSDEDVDDGLDRFELINSVRFQFITTNDEADNKGLFEVRGLKDQAGSNTTELVHYNQDGLSKSGTQVQIRSAAAAGSTRVVVTGRDAAGDELTLTNDDLKARTPFSQNYTTVMEAGRYMFAIFQNLRRNGILTVEAVNERAQQKIQDIRVRRAEARAERRAEERIQQTGD